MITILLLFSGIGYGQEQQLNISPALTIKHVKGDVADNPVVEDRLEKHYRQPISKEELFTKERTGITWEEFQNYPRRELTEVEVEVLKRMAEKREKEADHGPRVPSLLGRVSSLGDVFGNPSGSNTFNYSNALWGDVLLVHDGWVPWGYFRHAGMYDNDFESYGRPIYDSVGAGVRLTSRNTFWRYDEQFGLWASDEWPAGYSATFTAYHQLGKPYNWNIWNKWDTTKYYCSQLVWRAYYDNGVNIDSDGGSSVLPDDIYLDNDLSVWQVAW